MDEQCRFDFGVGYRMCTAVCTGTQAETHSNGGVALMGDLQCHNHWREVNGVFKEICKVQRGIYGGN